MNLEVSLRPGVSRFQSTPFRHARFDQLTTACRGGGKPSVSCGRKRASGRLYPSPKLGEQASIDGVGLRQDSERLAEATNPERVDDDYG